MALDLIERDEWMRSKYLQTIQYRFMKAIFLDIDGVIQYYSHQERFEHLDDITDLCKELNSTICNGFDYLAYVGGEEARKDRLDHNAQKCDIGAVYYDWNKKAVALLKRVIDETGAVIVLSSDWRQMGYEQVSALLDIHGLGKYLYDSTFFSSNHSHVIRPYSYGEMCDMDSIAQGVMREICAVLRNEREGSGWVDIRTAEILEYLDRHPEIDNFVAIDDLNLTEGLADHFVKVYDSMSDEVAEKMISILNLNDGPYTLPAAVDRVELEAWRKQMVYDNLQLFSNVPAYRFMKDCSC